MKKIIALALITSFAVTGAALAQTAGGNGQGSRGGNDGPGASDNNGAAPAVVTPIVRPIILLRRKPTTERESE